MLTSLPPSPVSLPAYAMLTHSGAGPIHWASDFIYRWSDLMPASPCHFLADLWQCVALRDGNVTGRKEIPCSLDLHQDFDFIRQHTYVLTYSVSLCMLYISQVVKRGLLKILVCTFRDKFETCVLCAFAYMAVNQMSATFIPHIIWWLILTRMLRSIIKSNCLRVLLTFEGAIIVFWPQVASWTRTQPYTVGLFHGIHFVIAAKAQVHLIFTPFNCSVSRVSELPCTAQAVEQEDLNGMGWLLMLSITPVFFPSGLFSQVLLLLRVKMSLVFNKVG